MESFFGGKKGVSFVISKRYDLIKQSDTNPLYKVKIYAINDKGEFITPYIEKTNLNSNDYNWGFYQTSELASTLIDDFKLGSACEVGYGEYVLIDTISDLSKPSHLDNGKIFRRGFDKGDGMCGAEYVGQIRGPKGGLTDFHMDTVAAISNKDNAIIREYTKAEMVSGETTDNITYAYVDVETDWETKDCYIGFKFPYMVNTFTAKSGSAYNQPTIVEDSSTVNRLFYKKWNLTIPAGKQGNEVKNIRLIEDTGSNSVVGILMPNGSAYTSQVTDTKTSKTIVVYDSISHETSSPVTTTYYIGDYNSITNISLTEDGTLIINYTFNETDNFQNAIKWINEISLSDKGELTINYNNGDEPFKSGNVIQWITGVTIADDGSISFSCNNDNKIDINNKFKWINDINIAENGILTVTYNNGSEDYVFNHLKWLKDITVDDNGTLTFSWNNIEDENVVFDKKIKWINNITATYQTADSGVEIPTGEWSDTPTAAAPSQFLWTKIIYSFNDGTTSDPIYSVAEQGPIGPEGPKWEMAGTLIIGSKSYDGTENVSIPFATTGANGEGIVSKLWDDYTIIPTDEEKAGVVATPTAVYQAYQALLKKIPIIPKFSLTHTITGTSTIDIDATIKSNKELMLYFYDNLHNVIYPQNLGTIGSIVSEYFTTIKSGIFEYPINKTFTFTSVNQEEDLTYKNIIFKFTIILNAPAEGAIDDTYTASAEIIYDNVALESENYIVKIYTK